ncbi:DapH/DapD/GlmU-related protein [Frondihabitans australicus]|uniref:Acetyltransferase-like isoleucine patch superfamily enzyme n=1 Tax=Frondihabitans australicus TaxID=386892 RepID=A0A495IEB4_9MICO|nr:DapH/DapD/GlmU-related protein [Frondihabitans australicus]RKR73990.1 acetyltransferase-like isoleucine patch superfamily enzyme [Frondihabitans australicus]
MKHEERLPIHDPELWERGESVLGADFRAMSARVLEVTALTHRLNALAFDDEEGRAEVLSAILGRPLPSRLTVYPPFYTDHGLNLRLGERVFINQGCTFLDYGGITLGDGVMVGPKATFITMGHPVDPGERRQFLTGAPIVVEENVWIGAGAMILPGVTIGRDSVVAAGAVVADDVPAQALVAGPKAAVVRRW